MPVKLVKDFPDAVAPRSLNYACAANQAVLADFFASKRLPLRADLLTERRGKLCHIFYEPTLRGYRAHTESHPVRGLVFTVNSRSLAGQRVLPVGDSLDVAREILKNVKRPLDVSIRTKKEVSDQWMTNAILNLFPPSRHEIRLRPGPADDSNIWAQDYIKSGDVGGVAEVLITRKAFEGNGKKGEEHDPLLKSFEERGWSRSKLSWDGGDLQFSLDPRDPTRTILFYGESAWLYWGRNLTPAEYEYVLLTEFGADSAVNLCGLAAHIDYFVTIFPDSKTLLISRYMRRNLEISLAAIDLLITRYGPEPVLLELRELYASKENVFEKSKSRALELLNGARLAQSEWSPRVDASVFHRSRRYIEQYCRDDEDLCKSEEGLERMLERDPELVRDWVGVATMLKGSMKLPDAAIALLYSQLEETGLQRKQRVEEKIAELKGLGYNVVEVPQFNGDVEAGIAWAGISYVNAVVIDNLVFVPAFGLGEAEHAIFQKLQRDIPRPFRVVPVFARYAMIANGGVHCVVGFLRAPIDSPLESSRAPAPQPLPATAPIPSRRD
jgi:hypothetical protein